MKDKNSMRLNLGFMGIDPLGSTLELVRLAEECGLNGAVSAEHLGFHDAVVPSALYLQQTSRLEIALVGLSAVGRHPGLMAMELASLSEIGHGRLRVQVGTGAPNLVAKFGGDMSRPLPMARSLVENLKSLLAGDVLTGDFPAGTFKEYGLQVYDGAQLAPYKGSAVPVDLMAVQPRMLRLSAEIADGVALSAGCSGSFLAEEVKNLEAELANNGRNREDFRITAFTYSVISPDAENHVAKLRHILGNYKPEAAAKRMRGVLDGQAYLEAALCDQALAVENFFTPEVLGKVAIVANGPDDLRDTLRRYANTGIDALSVHLVGPPQTHAYAVESLATAWEGL